MIKLPQVQTLLLSCNLKFIEFNGLTIKHSGVGNSQDINFTICSFFFRNFKTNLHYSLSISFICCQLKYFFYVLMLLPHYYIKHVQKYCYAKFTNYAQCLVII